MVRADTDCGDNEVTTSKSLGILWVSLSAIGGLIAIPALPGYTIGVVIPIIFALFSYVNYKLPENKRKFLILAVTSLLVGVILYWLPHSDTGGLSGGATLIALAVFIPSSVLLLKMFKSEHDGSDD